MASAQVDATHVEEFTKHPEETTFESPTIEGQEKAPATQNIKSPYDDDDDEDDDIALPDELGKEEDLDDDKDQKALKPQIIEDEDEDEDDDYNDEDDRAQAEEQASKFGSRATDFPEEDAE